MTADAAAAFVASWRLLEKRGLADRLLELSDKERPRRGEVVQWEIKNEVRPADLFCYLGARFGKPNGFQNFLRADHSDNLIHWEWSVASGPALINLQGLNFRTEIWAIEAEPSLLEVSKEYLAGAIKADFANYDEEMTTIRKALESWVEFANPYQRIRRSLSLLLDQLRDLRLAGNEALENVLDATDREAAQEQWSETAGRYATGLGLCFGVRSMLPVLAESFVNLVLYTLMRPELRRDARLKENAFRQAIDVRVKSLSINCTGFERPIDYTVDACKKFHTLINDRNDLLHGNVAIEKLKFNDLYFWGRVPVFKSYRTMWERSVGVEIQVTGLANLEKEVVIVEDFIAYVLTCLKPKIREQVKFTLQRSHLGINEEDGRLGVLFGERLADFRAGPPSDKERPEPSVASGGGDGHQ